MKYKTTEGMRRLNDAMDLHGGRGICDGQTNYLMAAYQAMPVASRSRAPTFHPLAHHIRQGALRSHPYLYKEIQACQDVDEERGLEAFDQAFCGHVAFSRRAPSAPSSTTSPSASSATCPRRPTARRSGIGSCGAPRATSPSSPTSPLPCSAAASRPSRSSRDAWPTRFPSYLLCCVLKRYEDDGKPANDRHIVALAAHNGLFRFQEAMRGTIDNFPVAPVRWLMRAAVPIRCALQAGAGLQGHKAVELVLTPGEVRDRLTRFIFVSNDVNDPTGLLEVTMAKAVAAETAEKSSTVPSAPARCAACTAPTGSGKPPSSASSATARSSCCARWSS